MDSDVTQSAFFYNFLDWAEAHRKQLLIGLIALVVVGLVITFYFVHQSQVQDDANNALSKLLVRTSTTSPEPTPELFMRVANDYPNTDGGNRAFLLAASELYTQGKYDEARAQFQRFLQEHPDSPFAGQAALGIASCLDAQGRTDDAINAYRNAADRYQTPNVAPQARMALARLYQTQGKLAETRNQLEEIVKNYPPPVSTDARNQLGQLLMAHPELMPANPQAQAPPMRPAPTVTPILSNRPPATPAASNNAPAPLLMSNKAPMSFSISNKP